MQPSSPQPFNLIKMGVITSAHGIAGQVKIKSFTSEPGNIGNYGLLYNQDMSQEFAIKVLSAQNNILRAKISNVHNRSDAESLAGIELYLPKERLPALEHGEYYYSDLIGLKIVTSENQDYGKVIAIYNFGAGDIVEIELSDSKKKIMHSFKNAIFPEVNLSLGFMVINILK